MLSDHQPPVDLEIAVADAGCTLPTAERPLRLAEFDDLFTAFARRVDHDGAVARIHLSGPTGLADRVRELTARESRCCSFFSFEIGGTDREPVLTAAAPPDRHVVVRALADRARRGSRSRR